VALRTVGCHKLSTLKVLESVHRSIFADMAHGNWEAALFGTVPEPFSTCGFVNSLLQRKFALDISSCFRGPMPYTDPRERSPNGGKWTAVVAQKGSSVETSCVSGLRLPLARHVGTRDFS
jgi:hypothetical protein